MSPKSRACRRGPLRPLLAWALLLDVSAPMRILLTNHALVRYAGTETFTYALATELTRRGHQVVCFSPRLGAVAHRLAAAGITVTDDLATGPDDIDVVHAQHRYESLLAFARYPERPMIFACHGVLPWQEQPLAGGLAVARYVAVSEEVRDHLAQRHRVPEGTVTIIRNGLDLDRFQPRSPIAPRPGRALIVSNYMPPEQRARIGRVCERLGITVSATGARGARWAVEEDINGADIVFGLGRSALEAMACRRVVIVYDYNGGDGLVRPESFEVLRRRNFSGRTHRRHYTDADLAAEISAYDPAITGPVHALIERDHDIRGVAADYLALYEQVRRSTPRSALSLRDAAIRQYGALARLLDDVRVLRAATDRAEASLGDIHRSRSWRAIGTYRKLKVGLRLLRRRWRSAPPPARILVVDDDPLVCRWLTDALSAEGHMVETVGDGRAALERLRAEPFDLVLADLQMPGVDGIELYRELQRIQPAMADRVIFLTGLAREQRYRRFLAGLEGRNLCKPFDVGQLTRLIDQRLNPTPDLTGPGEAPPSATRHRTE